MDKEKEEVLENMEGIRAEVGKIEGEGGGGIDRMREGIEDINEGNNTGTDIQVAVEETAPAGNTDDLQVAQNEEDIEDVVKNVNEKEEEDVIKVTQQVQVGAKANPKAKRKFRKRR